MVVTQGLPLSAVKALVEQGESQTLELKKSTAEKDRACRTLCAMANGQGGVVVERKAVAEADGKRLELLWVQVDKARHAPVSFRGVPYERVLIRRGRTEDPGTRDPLQILKGLGLVLRDGQLSRAAVALFCPVGAPLPEFAQLKLQVARFKGTDRNEFLDNRQYWGNAFALMRQAERFLLDWLPVAGKVVPGQLTRTDTPALPTEAVREALANAFVHRDYANCGGAVAVALFDDRLEIISAGELPFGLTPEMLFQPHESRPWNPLMANVFYKRGFIETWGRGTLKMADLLRDANLPVPVWQVKTGFVTLTFVLRRKMETEQTPVKTPDAILAWLAQTPSGTAPELAAHLGRSVSAVERAMRKLREAGRLIRVGPDKGGHWQVLAAETKNIE